MLVGQKSGPPRESRACMLICMRHMHAHTCVCMCTRMMCTRIHECTRHICTHTCLHVYTRHVHVYMCAHTCSSAHMHSVICSHVCCVCSPLGLSQAPLVCSNPHTPVPSCQEPGVSTAVLLLHLFCILFQCLEDSGSFLKETLSLWK